MPRPRNTPDLRGDRDRDILEHVARYRLTTPSVLFQLFFAADLVDDNAVTKVTSRLVDRDYLRKFDLYGSYKYFTLGKRGAKSVGAKPKIFGAPLGRHALYREFATLRFCCPGDDQPTGRPIQRERLTLAEIVRSYPELHHSRLDRNHYFLEQSDDGERLGYLWIDGGGDDAHIVRKIQQDIITPRLAIPILRERLLQGDFVLAIVTYLDDKKRQIIDAIRRQPHLQAPVKLRVEVIPDLLPLLPDRA